MSLRCTIDAAVGAHRRCTADDAIGIVGDVFDAMVATLKRDPRFQNIPRDELDLLLADVRRDFEQKLGDVLEGEVYLDDVLDDIDAALGGADGGKRDH